MTDQSPLRGGLPVGHVEELPPLEAAAVLALRLWCDGRAAQERLCGQFDAALGAGAGGETLTSLADLCDLMKRFGRRPLLRHQVGCTCVGADEACFAGLVAAASEGRHEDALMIAVLVVRPDVAPLLVGLAETLGHALRRVAGHRAVMPETSHPAPRNLH